MAKEIEIYGANTLSAFEYLANKDVRNNMGNDPRGNIIDAKQFTDDSNGKPVERLKIVFKIDESKSAVVLSPEDEAYFFILKLVENSTGMRFNATRAAEFLGLTSAELANIKNRVRKLNVNKVLRMFLLADNLPTIKEINHTLMAMNLPGLYLSTFFKEVNIKNAILTSAFEFMALDKNKVLDGKTRIKLVNILFNKYGLKCYFDPNKYGRFTKEDLEDDNTRALVEKAFAHSEELVNQVKEAQHEDVRRMALEKYAEANKIDIDAARVRIQRCFNLYSDSVKNHLFSYDKKNMSGREIVVKLGLDMECNFYDMTRLLIDANHPMLYWNREEDQKVIMVIYGKK